MKQLFVIMVCSLTLVGCTESAKPLNSAKPMDSGTVVSGMVWEHSRLATVGTNSGVPIPANSKVDVFESLIIIHLRDGNRQVVPLDYVSDLKIK